MRPQWISPATVNATRRDKAARILPVKRTGATVAVIVRRAGNVRRVVTL